MDKILFTVIMLAFGGSILVFIVSFLKVFQEYSRESKSYEGIIKKFLGHKLTKFSLVLFGVYVIAYAGYILTQL